MSDGVIFWDFDGTLAHRPGMWGGCVLEVLDEQAAGHRGSLERIRDALRDSFPWHRHEQPHPELSDPNAWWESVMPLLASSIECCGIGRARAQELAQVVRLRYIDATRGWRVFADAPAALSATASAGWRNVILSNHVPELPRLVDELGLGDLVEAVISSAASGYEKPHPEAFRLALRACGNPRRRWMVGDNPVADVTGAEAMGIRAVLVRAPQERSLAHLAATVERAAPDAAGAAELILSAAQSDGRCSGYRGSPSSGIGSHGAA